MNICLSSPVQTVFSLPVINLHLGTIKNKRPTITVSCLNIYSKRGGRKESEVKILCKLLKCSISRIAEDINNIDMQYLLTIFI